MVIKSAYKRGYYALDGKNPYSPSTQTIEYYAWLGGFNDFDMGYDLDLSVF